MHGDQEPVGAGNPRWVGLCVVDMGDDGGWLRLVISTLRGKHPEVAPAVLVVIREDRSDRGLILGPNDGGVLPLRVLVPHPFVPHRRDGVAYGSPEHHTVRRQAMRARMQDAREMLHGVSP